MLKINNGRIKRGKFELRNINLEIEKGELTAIVGKNSSGKSSLLYTVAGTIPLVEGTIERYDSKIAFVGTEFPFNKRLDAEQIAELHLSINQSLDKKVFYRYLEKFKIPKRKKTNELSTGQQKLLNLALALASENDLLLLDEININIDANNKAEFEKLFTNYISKSNKAILLSTNQLESLEMSVDNVIYIKNNEIAYNGSVFELINEYRLWSGSNEEFIKIKDSENLISFTEKEFYTEALLRNSNLGEETSLIKILTYLEKGL